MGMGFGANFADVIEDETLARLCPREHRALVKLTKKHGLTLEKVARELDFDAGTVDGEVEAALHCLQDAFGKKYEGLSIGLAYHDSENDGDRYDGVSGAYWNLEGVYVLSPAAKKLGTKNFERRFFVTFG